MKQFIITTTSFLFAAMQTTYAERTNIPLQVQELSLSDTNGQIRHAPPKNKLLAVEIDGNIIYVSSAYSHVGFTLILNDESNNIIYSTKVIASTNMSFNIPLDIIEKAVCITIYVAGQTYNKQI